MTSAKNLAILGLLGCLGHWPNAALGGHPLLTEDTGTQGVGRYQLELAYDSNYQRNGGTRTHVQNSNAVLSLGLQENLDFIVTLPHEHASERNGIGRTTASGIADMEAGVKWRFYEDEALSFALRPALGLPTGNESQGLGTGHVIPTIFAVMSYAADPWSFHLHFGYTRNFHDGPDERKHIYHASAAAEYAFDDALRLVGDASIESNAGLSGCPNAGSMVLGLVYSPVPDLDIDFGYRKGLTDAAPDHAWLAGMALRF